MDDKTDKAGQRVVFPADSYVAISQRGDCKVCGNHKDLRMGACFTCADHVKGQKISRGHELWDTRNPSNRWKVVADQ